MYRSGKQRHQPLLEKLERLLGRTTWLLWLPLIGVLAISGCFGAGTKGGIDAFRKVRDSDVGNPIIASRATGYPHEIRYLEDGRAEYIFEVPEIGCRFSFEVDQQDIVLSWRYLSEPERCYTRGDWWSPW